MYGKLALQQQKENEASKCGFSGAEWSPDLKAHIAWCSSVGPDQWKAQLQKRKQQLGHVQAGPVRAPSTAYRTLQRGVSSSI